MAWAKAIPEARDRLQSRLLVWGVGLLLAVPCAAIMLLMNWFDSQDYPFRALVIGLTFALAVWALRAATPMGALCGALVTFYLAEDAPVIHRSEWHSALLPLIFLFVLTFLATKAGKSRKVHAGLAESRRGRNAAQVLANLGAAGLAVVASAWVPFLRVHHGEQLLVLAVLAESTADTVSSEMGSVFGGRPFLLTNLRRVEPGTDGAVSLIGTLAGIAGASLVACVGTWAFRANWKLGAYALVSGLAGLVFDSVLGATLERRGWLGNDLVNFASTIFAASVAAALSAF